MRVCVCVVILFIGKIPVRVTAPGFELTFQRQKVSRLPTEPPGQNVVRFFLPGGVFLPCDHGRIHLHQLM